MKDYKLETIDFKLEATSTKDGKFYFIGKALSQDFECEEGLERLKKDVIRAPFVWRHKHPIQEGNKQHHIYGKIVDAWVKDYLYVKGEIYNHTADHVALIDLMQERAKYSYDEKVDPLSLSMHYRTYENEKGIKIHYDVFEVSGTPFPACKDCQTINNFKLEEKKMTNDEIENEEIEDTEAEDDEVAKALEKIKELEEQLNGKTQKLEDLTVKVAKLEEDISIKDKELEDKEEVAKTLEDRVLELEQKADLLEKKPFLDRIAEVKKIDDRELEFYKGQDIKYLSDKADKAEEEAKSQIVTKTLEESSEDATAEGSEADKEDKVSFEQFTSQLGLKTKNISD